jgi:hypothetical protein
MVHDMKAYIIIVEMHSGGAVDITVRDANYNTIFTCESWDALKAYFE